MQGSRNNSQQRQLEGPSLHICKMLLVLQGTNLGLRPKNVYQSSKVALVITAKNNFFKRLKMLRGGPSMIFISNIYK